MDPDLQYCLIDDCAAAGIQNTVDHFFKTLLWGINKSPSKDVNKMQ